MSTLQASSPTSTRSFASTRKTFTINIIQSEWDRIRLNDPDTGSPDFCKDLIGFIRRESYPKFVEELKKANKAVELIDTLEKVRLVDRLTLNKYVDAKAMLFQRY